MMYSSGIDMVKQKLGTFRIDESDWESFRELAKASGTSASAALLAYIQGCLESGKLEVMPPSDISIDTRIDEISTDIDKRIDKAVKAAIAPLRQEIDELKKPVAVA
jgi:hypothetical protein